MTRGILRVSDREVDEWTMARLRLSVVPFPLCIPLDKVLMKSS